jgi:hypothetical protein
MRPTWRHTLKHPFKVLLGVTDALSRGHVICEWLLLCTAVISLWQMPDTWPVGAVWRGANHD